MKVFSSAIPSQLLSLREMVMNTVTDICQAFRQEGPILLGMTLITAIPVATFATVLFGPSDGGDIAQMTSAVSAAVVLPVSGVGLKHAWREARDNRISQEAWGREQEYQDRRAVVAIINDPKDFELMMWPVKALGPLAVPIQPARGNLCRRFAAGILAHLKGK